MTTRATLIDQLNRAMPLFKRIGLGTLVGAVVTAANALRADAVAERVAVSALIADITALRTSFNTAITKLNADAGVTDTNYATAAALTVAAPAALTAAAVTDIGS